jgi:hypothetical protein
MKGGQLQGGATGQGGDAQSPQVSVEVMGCCDIAETGLSLANHFPYRNPPPPLEPFPLRNYG